MDRREWTSRLLEARNRYGLSVLDYTVTSNQIHLLVLDRRERETIEALRMLRGKRGEEPLANGDMVREGKVGRERCREKHGFWGYAKGEVRGKGKGATGLGGPKRLRSS
jgi:hypothetical protein